MISRELLKTEIDAVKSEHLELLYGIIRLLGNDVQKTRADAPADWQTFVASTYGCLSDAPISRGEQGRYDNRRTLE